MLDELTLETNLLFIYLDGHLLLESGQGTCLQHASRLEDVLVLRKFLTDLLNELVLLGVVTLLQLPLLEPGVLLQYFKLLLTYTPFRLPPQTLLNLQYPKLYNIKQFPLKLRLPWPISILMFLWPSLLNLTLLRFLRLILILFNTICMFILYMCIECRIWTIWLLTFTFELSLFWELSLLLI